uniref:Rieske domain-containing protein n=1 Tax=Fibrocapsa japonica TaxID=94617 RepID=A0A7S2USE0_9STRA|mmetsp:Transcript_10989/g.16181  ORF Transcript_10989/g.16181 Transcript_10989/m.16181 type:complete len:225 (+) Transcript_10989:45-719(+)|eukprot:CAMPEP_0113943948 /NCGR_PEP_ID=MMETSP1339-20121228/29860_1 /TAXON_ID=94617 /ORGANISM="Fibrocapsa japonica" /LENGTH=224 /DNA_ID=CAMNT_0000948965 /DNA_START=45 /DNA_END=719 /DNA_ORIENTATION=+ /assembly_acc=CAM_ASM_000762
MNRFSGKFISILLLLAAICAVQAFFAPASLPKASFQSKLLQPQAGFKHVAGESELFQTQLEAKKPRKSKRKSSTAQDEDDNAEGEGSNYMGTWIQVFESDEDMDSKEGATKAVEITDPLGKPAPVLMIRHEGKISSTEIGCGRCQFPLINGKIMDQDGEPHIECPLCGCGFSLSSGVYKEEMDGQSKGLMQNMMGGFMGKTTPKNIKVYRTEENNVGEVYIKYY